MDTRAGSSSYDLDVHLLAVMVPRGCVSNRSSVPSTAPSGRVATIPTIRHLHRTKACSAQNSQQPEPHRARRACLMVVVPLCLPVVDQFTIDRWGAALVSIRKGTCRSETGHRFQRATSLRMLCSDVQLSTLQHPRPACIYSMLDGTRTELLST